MSQANKNKAKKLEVGQEVLIYNSKTGNKYNDTIESISKKYITVNKRNFTADDLRYVDMNNGTLTIYLNEQDLAEALEVIKLTDNIREAINYGQKELNIDELRAIWKLIK